MPERRKLISQTGTGLKSNQNFHSLSGRVLADIWKQGVQIEVSLTFACPKCGTKYILLIRKTLYLYRFCFLRPDTALCVL